ncbi:hypothetical protein [Kordia sp.]|uniref:hypothetical protein n=1 Tax=Kordia sp. TaxID=1965332 RepID=UPI003D276293
MKKNRKALQFKKIKIANITLIKGGNNEDTNVSVGVACGSDNPNTVCDDTRNEASDIQNPCSDACLQTANRPNNNSVGKDVCFLGYCLQP